MTTLTCDMSKDCQRPVTHIGNKGYVYCASCAVVRRDSGGEGTRKMTPLELKLIQSGKPIKKY